MAYLGFSFGGGGPFPSADFLSPPLRVGARGVTPGKDALLNTISAFTCIWYSAAMLNGAENSLSAVITTSKIFRRQRFSSFRLSRPQRRKRIEISLQSGVNKFVKSLIYKSDNDIDLYYVC